MERTRLITSTQRLLRAFPAVALLGPRQVGKTTLARQIFSTRAKTRPGFVDSNYFDLEDPQTVERLRSPMLALEPLRGLVVIDEVQRAPELFTVLRVLLDRPRTPARFLILGSASRELLQQASESLAGRIAFLEVPPFTVREVGPRKQAALWLRGGYPRSYLARSEALSCEWREQYIRTFLERDIPQLGFNLPAVTMRRFWMMLAHYHGQLINYSEIARSLDISDASVRRYLEILAGTFMVRRLQPWFENIQKRQVKAPKIFVRDSGILHRLLGLSSMAQLQVHPKLGASWEGFATEEVLKAYGAREEDAYFWAVHEQGELDLLLLHEGQRLGFEFKHTDRPGPTRSTALAMKCLKLDELYIIHPGRQSYAAGDKVWVKSLAEALGV